MSVLIKGMDMPSKCYECFLQNECDLVNPYFIESTRPQDCPLVEVPSAERKGHWIWSPKDIDGTVSGCCSNCSFSHLFIGGHTAQYNYCPNCGARMVNEE